MQRRLQGPPIGITLSNAARDVNRTFDDALGRAGGSRPRWLILMSLKEKRVASQRELAAKIGIEGATLTHHLNPMETDGLITRRRDPANRRVHIVELTTQGEVAFQDMLGTVIAFDQRLRTGFTDNEVAELARLLNRMRTNVTGQSKSDTVAADITASDAPPDALPVSAGPAKEPRRHG